MVTKTELKNRSISGYGYGSWKRSRQKLQLLLLPSCWS